ncbi:MAG: NAD(P)H-dependent oxidoreductase [Crenarchaeota archaeon]|nr:MAG: NAD(P)H-dependent oxidoreductase [Thermoproteota archaeon]RDJ34487.1 MAG: NAD(P)H-dependent oxidoreductase [Thermoproteota archaeon]RDJ34826.1 MAG: NAD(P)H-dependent oxidoreductase [Thermoproteota archaeon]RDJ38571.1 MAG: NAD(P)H-dependent oxidoreductase [Thermoproteota archaeon]
MKIVVISGSPRKNAVTQVMMKFVFDYVKTKNHDVKFINLSEGKIDYYRGPDVEYNETTKQAAKDITEADVWIIGSPIYNSFFSAALKNLFEFINYRSTAGKVAGLAILASGNIGFTDVQTMLTQLMSYFRVITNPKAVYMTADMFGENKVIDSVNETRLKELVDETLVLANKVIVRKD